MKLHQWQKEALQFYFDNDNKALYQVVTGAGKTFFAITLLKQIQAQAPNTRWLIVVPKNVILETGWYVELKNAGVPLYDIGMFYGEYKEPAKITLTNMQNLDRLPMELFDGIIFDEIHNYGSERLIKYVNREFKHKVGLSATIKRLDKRDMLITKAFEYNIFKYDAKQAMADGILNRFDFCNVRVYMDNDDWQTYDQLETEIKQISVAAGGYEKAIKKGGETAKALLGKINKRKQLVNNYKHKAEVIKKIIVKHPDDKIIVFNQYNAQTNRLYWQLLDIGVRAKVFHSGIDKDKRFKILNDFKHGDVKVLLTTKVLDEGYNLKDIDVGVIMAGESSDKQTVQRLGRILRKSMKKSKLYQMYCVNTVEEKHSNKRSKAFKELCDKYEVFRYPSKT